MKTLVAVLLVTAQLLLVQPLAAAGAERAMVTETGTFAGARFRLPLGGSKTKPKPQLGLTFAPMLRLQGAHGRSQMRIGEGVAFGLTGSERTAKLSFGGRPLSAFATNAETIDAKNKLGVSTLGWVAIGVGAAAILYVVAASVCVETNCLNSD